MLSYEYTFDEKQVAAGDKTASPPPLVIQQDPDGVLASGVGATVWDSALVLAKYFELLAGEDEDGNHGRDLMQEPSRSLKKLLGSASTGKYLRFQSAISSSKLTAIPGSS